MSAIMPAKRSALPRGKSEYEPNSTKSKSKSNSTNAFIVFILSSPHLRDLIFRYIDIMSVYTVTITCRDLCRIPLWDIAIHNIRGVRETFTDDTGEIRTTVVVKGVRGNTRASFAMLKRVNVVSLFFAVMEVCPFCQKQCLSRLGGSFSNVFGHAACIRGATRTPHLEDPVTGETTPRLYVGSFGLFDIGHTEGTYKEKYTATQQAILQEENDELVRRVNSPKVWSQLAVTRTRNVGPITVVGQSIDPIALGYKRKKNERTYKYIKVGGKTLELRCFISKSFPDLLRILNGPSTVEGIVEQVIAFYHQIIAFDVWLHRVDPYWFQRYATRNIYLCHLRFWNRPEAYLPHVRQLTNASLGIR